MLRVALKVLVAIAVVMALLLAAAEVALRRPATAARIARAIGAAASTKDSTVTLRGLDTSSLWSPRLEELEITDRRGVWLRIENLQLDLAPLALLARIVRVRSISASRVELARLPEPDDEPFELRPLRWRVAVDRLRIDIVAVGRAVLEPSAEAATFLAPIEVDARGSVDLRRLTLDAELVAAIDSLDDLLAPLAVTTSHARMTVRAKGALTRPGGVVTLTAGRIEAGDRSAAGVAVRADVVRVGPGTPSYVVYVGGRVEGLRDSTVAGPHLGSAPTLVGEVRFGASPGELEIRNARLEAATFAVEIEAATTRDSELQVKRATVVVPDLHATPELADLVESGVLRLRGNATIRGWDTEPSVTATVTGETLDLVLSDPNLQHVVGPRLEWSVELLREASGLVRLDAVQVRAAGFRAEGSGRSTADERVSAAAAIEIDDLGAFAGLAGRALSGAAHLDAEAGGTLTAPELRLIVRSDGARVEGSEAIAGEIDAHSRLEGREWVGGLAADLQVGSVPATLGTRYRYAPSERRVAVEGLAVKVAEATLAADGDVDLGGGLARGRMHLAAATLSPAASVFGLSLQGEADVVCQFDHDGRAQRGTISGTVASLRYQRLDLERMTFDVSRDGGGLETRFTLAAAGKLLHGFEVEAGGRYRGGWSQGEATVERFDGQFAGHPITARAPLRVDVDRGTLHVRELDLTISGGGASGYWRGDLYTGVGEIRIDRLPLKLAELLYDRARLAGTISGVVGRSRGDATLDLDLRTDGAGIPDSTTLNGMMPFDLTVVAKLGSRRSGISATIRSIGDGSALDLDVDMPAGLGGVAPGAGVGGSVRGQVAAGLVGQLTLPADDVLTGTLDVELSAAGTLAAPKIDGRVHGAVGYSSAATGMELRIDEIDLRASGRRIEVVALRGQDTNGGRVEGSGQIELGSSWSSSRLALEAAFEDLYLAKIDELRLRGDGSVALAVQGGTAAVSGEFAADEAIVRIPSKLPPDIATLPVEHVHLEASRNGAAAVDAPPGRPMELDLTLRFPSRLRIEDPNLDSEWRGRIRVSGNTNDPDVLGSLTITRGTFSIGGVRFRAREGTLSFDDDNNMPIANIVAVAVRNDIEATLRLSGRLDRIEFELTSEPPLPQDEILSRLMFGSTAGTLTPGQAIQLAQAVARLSGHGPQVDVLSRVRRFAGVDRIEIKETQGVDGPGTAVSVGKYLTDRVYLSVDQAVDGGGSTARVEVEVTEHIAAETEIGQDENASIGVKWRWSY